MQKSFIERIFPQTSSPLLPTSQHERRSPRTSLPSTPSPISSELSSSPSRPHHILPHTSQSLKPTPLSASIIHHSDPLLPVDRQARALQKTIQSLLDAQSDGLSAGLGAGSHDDISSVGSLTPTPSVATPPRSMAGHKVTPFRQPVPKKVSLRGARRGLTRSMQEFVQLKEKELKILDSQSQGRRSALDRVHAFEDKRSALQAQIDAFNQEGVSAGSEQTHREAQQLDMEIRELEDRVFELKARQRHVLAQASQIENSVSSKLSSYVSSLELVDREIKQYLRRPPVQPTLAAAAGTGQDIGQTMYDLKPGRRTLSMAKEQWTNEQTFLDRKRTEAEREKAALQRGSMMWRQIVDRIQAFEKELRVATRDLSQSAASPEAEKYMYEVLPNLDSTIEFLKSSLQRAEKNQWNLLICCIGPELEAFQQARLILSRVLGLPSPNARPASEEELDGPDQDLMNGHVPRSPSADSNKSLEDTMKVFGDAVPGNNDADDHGNGKTPSTDPLTPLDKLEERGFGFGPTKAAESESEEDDPGPDFLLSHT